MEESTLAHGKFKLLKEQVTVYPDLPELKEYSRCLEIRHINYEVKTPHLLIRKVCVTQGQWRIHVSVIKQDMPEFLAVILDYLIASNCAFSIPQSDYHHNMILDGSMGIDEIGKIVTVWPKDPVQALTIAQYLIQNTSKFNGPTIPTAIHLLNCVYTSFDEQWVGNPVKRSYGQKNDWPFKEIIAFKALKNSKWISKRYFKFSILKKDAKGNVYKAFDFRKLTDIQWCVIKQGKKYQCVDHAGRDVRDRLEWQFRVQSELANHVSVPNAIDLIFTDDDAFLIMQFIEGESYHNYISSIQQGIIWHDLGDCLQDRLIALALQVTDVIAVMHKFGYVHRDLNPVNFIVTPEEKVFAIDLELSYNCIDHEPDPFFTLGTPGYMSPQQRNGKQPGFEDDIYGLGAILTRTLTGLSPIKFNLDDPEKLFQSINHFVRNERLSAFISSCLDTNPERRPDLSSVKRELEFYRSLILINKQKDALPEDVVAKDEILRLTTRLAIDSLFKPPLLTGQSWLSKKSIDLRSLANNYKGYYAYPDLYLGASGIIYVLTLAEEVGYDLSKMKSLVTRIYELTDHEYKLQADNQNIGLYRGISGFNVITAYLGKKAVIPLNDELLNLMAKRFSIEGQGLSLSDGLVGQAFAIMKCSAIIGLASLPSKVADIVQVVLKSQERDGSWKMDASERNQPRRKMMGFLNGVSGICYFLMIYAFQQNDPKAKDAAQRGLNWLLKSRQKHNNIYNWPVSCGGKDFNPWFESGFTGVAFLFIRAFQLFKDPAFKEAACSSLMAHPFEITSNYISQGTGLAGLGEVYLEAYRVFHDAYWLKRAEKIADYFLQIGRSTDDGTLFWLDGNEENPEAAFMTGNAGIIHFLLRYQYPDKIPFPLLTLSN
ncbi:lanthionine synthetase LanC family protein [Mucilaginibacter sp. cycad4]|uniref:lanthionine synthetase LanC family protein n=1 Tax=Mucilaginibacter sp. cycad4 TaxID=3342096 RepID=UPI002AAABC91|nr:lanthionine synthetase LanC family protein [Mucilaginibacter gossypii]WPU99081.1 lanthionine synthetase LanC family protein [Mucilaginibacter gossypii]